MLTMTTRVCPTCKVEYAMPTVLYESARQTGAEWWCPNGHKLHFPRKAQEARTGLSPPSAYVQTLEARNASLQARVRSLEADCACALDMAEAEADARRALQHRLSSARSRARSLRREHLSGVCPWCHKSFDNLRRHLAARHQGFIEAQRHIA